VCASRSGRGGATGLLLAAPRLAAVRPAMVAVCYGAARFASVLCLHDLWRRSFGFRWRVAVAFPVSLEFGSGSEWRVVIRFLRADAD